MVKKNLIFFCLIITFFAVSCDKDQSYDKSKAITAYFQDENLTINVNDKSQITIPKPIINKNFFGSLTNINQEIEHFEKKYNLSKTNFLSKKQEIIFNKNWTKSVLNFSAKSENFHYQPVIVDNKIYFMDGSGMLYCYDLTTKKKKWNTQVFKKSWIKNYRSTHLSFANNKIFATIGTNHLISIDATNGKIIWQKQVSAILNSIAISSDNKLFVVSDTNKLYCFDANNSNLIWTHFGVNRNTAIFGNSEPLIYKDKVLIAYSSGEIYALNKNNGEVLWVNDLNINKAVSSDFYLSDIDASMMIKNNIVYAIGNSGIMKAIDVNKGNVIWKKQIAGIANFWLAGDYLFIINNDNKLIAINRNNASIKWIASLPNFKNQKKPTTKFIYNGIIMAGNKLLISREDGEILLASITDGKVEKSMKIGDKISHFPVIVNDKIYFQNVGLFSVEIIELD